MLATPFTPDGRSVDHLSLERYCHTVVTRGCSAVVVLGVIGEPASLSAEERLEVVGTAVASGLEVHVATMMATPGARLVEATAVVEHFGDRIAGLLVPVTTSDPDILRREIDELYAACGRPLVLQDYPASSGSHIRVDDLAKAVDGLPYVTAIKCEAAPTFARIRQLRELVPDVVAMSGLGGLSLVDDLTQGAGLVASGTSRPEVAVRAVQAWLAGDEGRARELVGAHAAAVGFEIQQGISIAIRKEHWRRQAVLASAAVRPPAMPYEPWLAPLSEAHGFASAQVDQEEQQ